MRFVSWSQWVTSCSCGARAGSLCSSLSELTGCVSPCLVVTLVSLVTCVTSVYTQLASGQVQVCSSVQSETPQKGPPQIRVALLILERRSMIPQRQPLRMRTRPRAKGLMQVVSPRRRGPDLHQLAGRDEGERKSRSLALSLSLSLSPFRSKTTGPCKRFFPRRDGLCQDCISTMQIVRGPRSIIRDSITANNMELTDFKRHSSSARARRARVQLDSHRSQCRYFPTDAAVASAPKTRLSLKTSKHLTGLSSPTCERS